MGKFLLTVVFLIGLLYLLGERGKKPDAPAPASASDSTAGLRGACKQFIERQQLEAKGAEWGEYWNWTVIGNADGSFSVGARYAVASHTRYTTCILWREGSDIRLEKLSRLQ